MNKKWLLAVITVLGVVYPKMSLSKISQRTHEKFCDVTFTHHVLSKFSRENGGDLIENATYSYFIEGRKNPVVEIDYNNGREYRGCSQEIPWIEKLRTHFCEFNEPKAESLKEIPYSVGVPSLFVFFFDGGADFNAKKGKELGAINLDGSEGNDMNFGNFNGGRYFGPYIGKRSYYMPSDRQLHYHASSGLHSNENYESARSCYLLMDRYLDFYEKIKGEKAETKISVMGFSNGAQLALKFQGVAKKAKRYIDLLISVDPVPQAAFFHINKIKSLVKRRDKRTKRLINIFQNDDYGSLPPLKLRGRPVKGADYNFRLSNKSDWQLSPDGQFNHLKILQTNSFRTIMDCELKALTGETLGCRYRN